MSGFLFPLPASADTGGLRPLGLLPIPKDKTYPPEILAIDSRARRMYAEYADPGAGRLLEYDLNTRVPTLRREAPIPMGYEQSKARAALDSIGHRLFLADLGAPGECLVCSYIRVIDLKTFKMQASYNITTLIPNFFVQGVTFSESDRLLYLTGSHGGPLIQFGEIATLPYYPLGVASFDPDKGSPVWWKVVPQCRPMSSFQPVGAMIARSRYEDALYVGCIRADPPQALVSYPGESGLVRVRFTPRADTGSAALFPVEYFPISGTYTDGTGVSGMTEHDPIRDRFYMLSQSALTPGAWVFDGRRSAWVGFVAAVARDDRALGVDSRSGHIYMRSGTKDPGSENAERGLIVADGRTTPIAQGTVHDFPNLHIGYIFTDPPTRRVLVPVEADAKSGRSYEIMVLVDETSARTSDSVTDYDSLTTDVPEGSNTQAAYSGSLNGYGSRVALVGGTGGITTSVGVALNDLTISPGNEIESVLGGEPPGGLTVPTVWDRGTLLGVGPGDRGLFLGHVGAVDLRNSGAAASAQAITPDTNTANEYVNQQNAFFQQLDNGERDPEPWPWPVAVCLDGEGKPAAPDESDTGTEAKASCDLKGAKADAHSAAGTVALPDGVSIGASSFDGSAVRTPGEGIVTTATAVASNVRVTVPGAGSLSIGRIRATARTVAQGRPGTAKVEWIRDIDYVAITDASGKALFSCAKQCDTSAIEDAVRQWAGMKIAIRFPTPRTISTPRGAFAEVQKTDAAYYDGFVVNNDETFSSPAAEILVYNDYGERSRLLVQLAAIQASSIYGISLIPPDSGFLPDIPPIPPVGDILDPVLPPPPIVAPPPAQGDSLLERIISSSRFLIRSPGDALLIALIATLTLAAGAAAWRRRSLLGLLDDFGVAAQARPTQPPDLP